ncbi:MAG TPA: ATP-binding protein [Nitrospirae bacterium]|nr:non-motile and phage-resistance protein [bacterium BMS3Abin09]GBE41735.1 non-motile and phage-resistance protein [bacterium BMS3Bbin09]HDN94944.1 ATP-binding protein [Nitrospirota bacterium]HDO67669.1 ATP-binding protein [Nitrospirota bacterium]HDZ83990.1 ATP-binding protein [Nitrospirota bacterium]
MEDLSLHILDVVENCITADATRIEVKITEDTGENLLTVEMSDNGKGMSEELLENATDPFYTTRTTRKVGLGIPLLAQSAKESNGDISVKSKPGQGTSITATFQYDHIDRKPLGDIGQTIIILIMSNPEIDFLFEHKKNDKLYTLDTVEMKKDLDGIPINNPEVIKIIKNDISAWLNSINNV